MRRSSDATSLPCRRARCPDLGREWMPTAFLKRRRFVPYRRSCAASRPSGCATGNPNENEHEEWQPANQQPKPPWRSVRHSLLPFVVALSAPDAPRAADTGNDRNVLSPNDAAMIIAVSSAPLASGCGCTCGSWTASDNDHGRSEAPYDETGVSDRNETAGER